MTEQDDGWCWDDIVKQCIPDLSGGCNWKISAAEWVDSLKDETTKLSVSADRSERRDTPTRLFASKLPRSCGTAPPKRHAARTRYTHRSYTVPLVDRVSVPTPDAFTGRVSQSSECVCVSETNGDNASVQPTSSRRHIISDNDASTMQQHSLAERQTHLRSTLLADRALAAVPMHHLRTSLSELNSLVISGQKLPLLFTGVQGNTEMHVRLIW